MIYIDTHLAMWIFECRPELLSNKAQELIESNAVYVSPMVRLELDYLYEIERTRYSGQKVLDTLETDIDIRICGLPLVEIAEKASKHRWTRDPFDRLMVAHAQAKGNKAFVTKDDSIRENYTYAVW